jgi:alanine racemase
VAHRTWVEINANSLAGNIDALRGLLKPGTRFCAVVKANAYGHGLREAALIAGRCGVDAFAVDAIDDAILLRELFPSALVLTLGYVLSEGIPEAVRRGIDLTVYDADTVARVEQAAASFAKTANVHVKIETGTSRQGVLPEHLNELLDAIRRSPHVALNGVSTHFANIEDAENASYAQHQFGRFLEAKRRIHEAGFAPEHVHCACSAAMILYPETRGTLVRAGISMYGLWSSPITEDAARRAAIKLSLTPVLSWKTRVAQVKSLPSGTPVGYGLTEVLQRNSRIAVVPVGYWDGYPRGLSSIGEVLIGSTRCKVLGRICMNMMMVDVSEVPRIAPEDEVVLIGKQGEAEVTAAELASRAQTIHYELVTRINTALPRLVV